MGVWEVVGEVRPGPRGGKGESGGRVGSRGGAMQVGSGTGRDTGQGIREERNKVET